MRLRTQVYKKYFPDIAVGYQDPRVHVHIKDGKMLRHLFCNLQGNMIMIHEFYTPDFLTKMQELLSSIQFLKALTMPLYWMLSNQWVKISFLL